MSWLLRNARIDATEQLYHVRLEQNHISAVVPAQQSIEPANHETWDLKGKVLLPGLVETHTHLDKTYSPAVNPSGTLVGAIEVMRQHMQQRSIDSMQRKAEQGLRQAISMGVTSIRSHIDIATHADLAVVEALLALREQYHNRIQLQLVTLGDTSTEAGLELTSQALALGVDMIGGAPVLTNSPETAIDNAMALAEQTGCGIDLHLDENNDPASRTLEYLADRCIEHNWQGLVCASHCCSLGFMPLPDRQRIIDKLARAGIHVITLPACNLVLISRDEQPKPRGATPVKELLAGGVNVAAGSDNVQDPFNPFGNYDPLASAQITAQVGQMTSMEELATALLTVTSNAASAFGLEHFGIHAGTPASLVVLDSDNYDASITAPPARLATFFNGNPVVRTHIKQYWLDQPPTDLAS